ncbi:MAG: GerMN domain-containing protein [Candidatus Eisenbacteria bacterium]|nr:GerMN domain-containing protein [Candidatus Eisenbacteria bacterium]
MTRRRRRVPGVTGEGRLTRGRILWGLLIIALVVAAIVVYRGLGTVALNPRDVGAGTTEAGAPVRILGLYFGAPDQIGLVREERAVPDPGGRERLGEAVAREVLAGSSQGISGWSSRARVKSFFLMPDGTGYLDLSSDALARWPRGDGLEWVSIASLVRSLIENVPGIRAVQILVDGKIVERAPGSIPIDLPLDLATLGLSPEAEAEAEAGS